MQILILLLGLVIVAWAMTRRKVKEIAPAPPPRRTWEAALRAATTQEQLNNIRWGSDGFETVYQEGALSGEDYEYLVGLWAVRWTELGQPVLGQPEHRFYGIIKLDGVYAVEGSILSALIDGTVVAEATVGSGGNFNLTVVQPEGADYTGKTISFLLNYLATQTATWTKGATTSLTLTIPVPAGLPPGPPEGREPIDATGLGDVDMDGKVDEADSILIARFRAFQVSLTDEQQRRADVNKNGKVDIGDAGLIDRWWRTGSLELA